ncbi:MAG: hypothetical protein ACR2IV_22855 [Bryobacteraceae bacterium]
MNKLKKYPAVLIALLLAEAFIISPLAKADEPSPPVVRNHRMDFSYAEIRAGECSTTDPNVGVVSSLTPRDSLLYNLFCNPVVAPDGHQLTLAEFQAAQVRSALKCTGAGTHSILHFRGLVPNATYTVWLFVHNSVTETAVGALGTTMPIENSFTTCGTGEGQLSVITPAENLSVAGAVDSCFLDSPFELHLVYHIDNASHGPVPGPDGTWITVGTLLFP